MSIALGCERREYKKQTHADRSGKEDLHSVIVSSDHIAERDPNDCRSKDGQSLQPSTFPRASEMSEFR